MSSWLQKGSWGCCPIGIRETALDLESGRQERSGVPFQINALGLILLFTHVYKVSGSLLRASTMPTVRRSQHRAEKSCPVFSMSLLRRCTGKASAYQGRRCKRPTRVQTLGPEDPLEEEMATHSSILAWEIQGQRDLVGYSLWGLKESDRTEQALTAWVQFSWGGC